MDTQMIASNAPKPAIQRGKITWPVESSQQQNFSFPSSIIYYISKNPSNPTSYLKHAQSCKYFFEKLPLLIAKDIYWMNGKSLLCPNIQHECMVRYNKCCIAIDLAKTSSKIWLTNEISIDSENPLNFVSLLTSKLFRSDIIQFELCDQEIAFNDFKLMASSAKKIYLNAATIICKDGNEKKLDAVLEALPNLEKILCSCKSSMFDSSTLKNIAKLSNLSKLQFLGLCGIPETAKVDDLLVITKKHRNAKIQLEFDGNISDGFKNQLNAMIDVILKDESMKCVIKYDGQDIEKLKILQKRM